jgi:hypothetical protein
MSEWMSLGLIWAVGAGVLLWRNRAVFRREAPAEGSWATRWSRGKLPVWAAKGVLVAFIAVWPLACVLWLVGILEVESARARLPS